MDQPSHLKLYMGTRAPPPIGTLQVWLESIAAEGGLADADVSNEDKGDETISVPTAELRLDGQPRLSISQIPLELTSPSSIVACAEAFRALEPKLDILVSNAVIMPSSRQNLTIPRYAEGLETGTEDVESALMTNVIGHAILFDALEESIRAAGTSEGRPARLVLVSSDLHRKADDLDISPDNLDTLLSASAYSYQRTYSITKCIQTIYQYGLHERLGSAVRTFSVSPGFVPSTSLNRSTPYLLRLIGTPLLNLMPFVSTPEQAGKRIANACFEEDFEIGEAGQSGVSVDAGGAGASVYLKNDKIVQPGKHVMGDQLRREWMAWIEERVRAFTPPT